MPAPPARRAHVPWPRSTPSSRRRAARPRPTSTPSTFGCARCLRCQTGANLIYAGYDKAGASRAWLRVGSIYGTLLGLLAARFFLFIPTMAFCNLGAGFMIPKPFSPLFWTCGRRACFRRHTRTGPRDARARFIRLLGRSETGSLSARDGRGLINRRGLTTKWVGGLRFARDADPPHRRAGDAVRPPVTWNPGPGPAAKSNKQGGLSRP